jgi:hypothetical protein
VAVPPVMLAVDPTLIIILTAKPPSIAMLSASFLRAGLAQPFEHVGVVFRPHSMIKKRGTLCAKHWTSKRPEGVTISVAAV